MLKNRRSIRFKEFDYSSAGAYFITLVTHHHAHLFGKIENGEMNLNEFSRIVKEEWFRSAILRPSIELEEDEFVVMPNHVHGIIWIVEQNKVMDVKKTNTEKIIDSHGTGDLQVARTNSTNPTNSKSLLRPKGPISNSVGAIIAGFKAATTKRINIARGIYSQPVWLRNYYEHIIETEREYFNIVNYIHDNPGNWGVKDEYY